MPFIVARAEDIPKNWAVLDILQQCAQPIPRARDLSMDNLVLQHGGSSIILGAPPPAHPAPLSAAEREAETRAWLQRRDEAERATLSAAQIAANERAWQRRIEAACSNPQAMKRAAYTDPRKYVVSARSPKPPASTSIFKAPAAAPASGRCHLQRSSQAPGHKAQPQACADAHTALPSPPSPPPPPQHHNGYIYVTSHARIVKSNIRDQGNPSAVVISGGFEVAPGDASDIEVTNANPWGGLELYFGDGHYASTAIKLKNLYQNDPQRGMARFVVKPVNLL